MLTDLTAEPGRIVFRDNGIGMSRRDLETFLSTVGRSGTRAAAGDAPDVIGQFGIGFLSGFVVGARVTVRTRHWRDSLDAGCLWENDGTKDYSIRSCVVEQPGTEVIVHLASAEDRGLLQDEAVKKVIRDYADMLKVPIYLNDPNQQGSPVNTRTMPWERTGSSDSEMRLDCLIYLEKTVPGSVLDRQWHLLLRNEIERINPVQPRRAAIHAEIGQLVRAGGIVPIDPTGFPIGDAMPKSSWSRRWWTSPTGHSVSPTLVLDVLPRPAPTTEHPQHRCLDKGYDCARVDAVVCCRDRIGSLIPRRLRARP
ncbi:ATP-binding protein [uncultured Lamprocystis sp.]|uniref:ATP-binding protein n=1 Tax=uncultured Lamprocystis sp. TaxID=543132 RepID=UPI0025EE2CA4|nr:ATP-binding protein [uncultured Lamprocystis sp.]